MQYKLKICFWTTTFQADVWSLAKYLCQRDDFEVVIVLENMELFFEDTIHRLMPLDCVFLERESKQTIKQIREFKPDITIVDNHFPSKKLSEKLFVLWHGFGWKGPNDVKEFASVHKVVKKLTGVKGMVPNSNFVWQCFGMTDLEHRNAVSGFARENLRSLGAAMTDDIVAHSIHKEEALKLYPKEFEDKKIALLAFTWHYGKVFSHWGDDIELFGALLRKLNASGYAVILRMHDKKRYDNSYLAQLKEVADANGIVCFKYKDSSRDNLVDIAVSDVMISNFSSILNYFYATGKPSIHVYPVKSKDEAFIWRTYSRGKVREKEISSVEYIWKLSPEENGGLTARSFEQLLECIELVTVKPDCCLEKSNTFIKKHMAPADGKVCENIAEELIQLYHC